jgi:hypothetical protein
LGIELHGVSMNYFDLLDLLGSWTFNLPISNGLLAVLNHIGMDLNT